MELNFQDDGAGRAVVVLHGLFGSLSNWKRIARQLAGERRMVTADLRNHGRSPWSDDVSYPAMAEDVAALIDRLGIDAPIIVGHSMGGKVAMTLAQQQPERVAGLVVVDIAPVVYPHSHIDLIHTLLEIDLSAIGSRKDFDAVLSASLPDPALRMFLSQNLVFDDGAYRWRINLRALAAGMDLLTGYPELPGAKYPGPACFVYGAESDYVMPQYLPAIRSRFPHATLQRVDGAGHWVHAEAPDRVMSAILKLGA